MDEKWVRLDLDALRERGEDRLPETTVVMYPEGKPLSDAAIETICRMSCYSEGKSSFVLLGDTVGALVAPEDPQEMALEAIGEGGCAATGRLHALPLSLDDGHGMLAMGESVFICTDRPLSMRRVLRALQVLKAPWVMKARRQCIETCYRAYETREALAAVYGSDADGLRT